MSRKYKPGCYIISLDDLMKQEFVYCAGKLVHKGWFGSWQLRYANSELARLRIREAKKIEDNALTPASSLKQTSRHPSRPMRGATV